MVLPESNWQRLFVEIALVRIVLFSSVEWTELGADSAAVGWLNAEPTRRFVRNEPFVQFLVSVGQVRLGVVIRSFQHQNHWPARDRHAIDVLAVHGHQS